MCVYEFHPIFYGKKSVDTNALKLLPSIFDALIAGERKKKCSHSLSSLPFPPARRKVHFRSRPAIGKGVKLIHRGGSFFFFHVWEEVEKKTTQRERGPKMANYSGGEKRNRAADKSFPSLKRTLEKGNISSLIMVWRLN